jgi:UDP-2-acetamido-2,6-beta-L-arabino-hexul-4-ose reductase
MRVAVTGAGGFLGWHARCALRARGCEVVAVGRDLTADGSNVGQALAGVDAVLHLAGVNRPPSQEGFEDNVTMAQRLTSALDGADARPSVVYANSIQSGNGSPFGRTKEAAAELLLEWGQRVGAAVCDVRLPNLFGEHGRAGYNSVVANFCDALANGREPTIHENRELSLLHVQDAVDQMIDLMVGRDAGVFRPEGSPTTVVGLLEKLTGFSEVYRTGDVPDISDRFDRALFNTYRSFCFPAHYPILPELRADQRGVLFEGVRSHGGRSQTFSSTTHPGVTRGNHFHLRKVERFLVLQGSAVISLRRVLHDEVVRFEVSGDRPAIVDMPTLWTHSIRNTGQTELITLFWSDEIFDPTYTDTFAEPVEPT